MLQRKAVTNDLYSRVGHQIATPRKNIDGLTKLPVIGFNPPGSNFNPSVLEQPLTELQMNHQDSLLKRSSTQEQQLIGPQEYVYYEFITNSSVEMFDEPLVKPQPEFQKSLDPTNDLIASSIERHFKSEQKTKPFNNHKSHRHLLPPPLDNKENQIYASNQQVSQKLGHHASGQKSRRNLVQRANRHSMMGQ